MTDCDDEIVLTEYRVPLRPRLPAGPRIVQIDVALEAALKETPVGPSRADRYGVKQSMSQTQTNAPLTTDLRADEKVSVEVDLQPEELELLRDWARRLNISPNDLVRRAVIDEAFFLSAVNDQQASVLLKQKDGKLQQVDF